MSQSPRIAIIGAGPAGLMAAEALGTQGYAVDIYDAMPSFGRKFLMAGKSGLNITHAEDADTFQARYICADARLRQMVQAFGAIDIVEWMEGLGIEAHTGPTGRIFPVMMKASPLLRSWLSRLSGQGTSIHTRHRWRGWSETGALRFETPEGLKDVKAEATVLALGGASWKRLGSDGVWADMLAREGVQVAPFQPSNCGFLVDWSAHLKERFAGMPVKSVELSVGDQTSRAEFVITERGVESGGVYMLSAPLREALRPSGEALLMVDLLPDIAVSDLRVRLGRSRGKQSLSNHLRKTARLSGVKLALLYEVAGPEVLLDSARLAALIKALPLRVTGTAPMDEGISTAGGVAWSGLTNDLMLKDRPSVFCAGEMLDWDAPTGGYLITACLATGHAAGIGAANWLSRKA